MRSRNQASATFPSANHEWQRCRIALFFILGIFLVTALTYGLLYPLGEGPDEVAHVNLVKFIADQGRLPQNQADREMAGRKSDWPLSYHALVGVATGWVDLDALPELELHKGSLRSVLITDKVSPFALVHTQDEAYPFRGVVLLWHVARCVSALLGVLSLVVIYQIARRVFPYNCWLALGAMAITAAIPQFQFISSVVNDDNLVRLFSALFTWVLLETLANPEPRHRYLWLGLWCGLAVTTKYTVALFPVLVLVVVAFGVRCGDITLGQAIKRIGIFASAMLVAAAWWFVYVQLFFNRVDELGLFAGLVTPLVGDRSDATTWQIASLLTGGTIKSGALLGAAPSSLWQWVLRLFQSSWFVAGQHMTITLPRGFYWGFLAVSLLAVLGILRWGVRFWRDRMRSREASHWQVCSREYTAEMHIPSLGVLALQIVLLLPVPLLRFFITRSAEEAGQGRHILFPAAAAIGIMLTVGLLAWLPRARRRCGILAVSGCLFLMSLTGFFGFVLPSYPPLLPVRNSVGEPPAARIAFADGIELVDYDVGVPNESGALPVTLGWYSRGNVEANYLVDLSLVDENGNKKSRSLAQPVDGRYPTLAWKLGDWIHDEVWLPLDNVPAGDYRLNLALCEMDSKSGLSADICDELGNVVTEVRISATKRQQKSRVLQSQTGETLGFDVWKAGKPVLGLPSYPYRAQIPITLDSSSIQGIWLMTADGQSYEPKAQTGDLYSFLVGPDWSSSEYSLRVSWEGRLYQSKMPVLDAQVRQRSFDIPPMLEQVNANFGDQMILLGFDAPVRKAELGGGIPITTYWMAKRQMAHNYIISNRLLDIADLGWGGGVDHVPQGYYTTLLWAPGEVIEDKYWVTADPAASPGVYRLDIGVYYSLDGEVVHLPLLAEDRESTANTVTIDPFRVGGPPAIAVVSHAVPQYPRTDTLGMVISLIGYDLKLEQDAVQLVLYWRCDAPVLDDYTTFVHVLTVEGQEQRLIAQRDYPPSEGAYPTSLWDVGEIICDPFTIPLPPKASPNNIEIAVGLYDPTTGTRLQVPGTSDDSVRLTPMIPTEDDVE